MNVRGFFVGLLFEFELGQVNTLYYYRKAFSGENKKWDFQSSQNKEAKLTS